MNREGGVVILREFSGKAAFADKAWFPMLI
jgi:hypothetical protein